MRSALVVSGKLVLAYVLLATFWADAAAPWSAPGPLWRAIAWLLPGGDHARDYAIVSVIGAVLVPIALLRVIGPWSRDAIGIRRPSRDAVQIGTAQYLSLLPLMIAMALHPAFRPGLDAMLAGSPWVAVAVPVGLLAEHFFFHAVLLAWLHPSGRFPPASELAKPIAWPALAAMLVRTGERRAHLTTFVRSLAIPKSCLVPCLLSGPLFFVIHVGKPDGELWLSLPAGVVFAWLAYRTNGFVVPLLVHASLPATAALIALLIG